MKASNLLTALIIVLLLISISNCAKTTPSSQADGKPPIDLIENTKGIGKAVNKEIVLTKITPTFAFNHQADKFVIANNVSGTVQVVYEYDIWYMIMDGRVFEKKHAEAVNIQEGV